MKRHEGTFYAVGIGIGGFCTGQAEESDLLHDACTAEMIFL